MDYQYGQICYKIYHLAALWSSKSDLQISLLPYYTDGFYLDYDCWYEFTVGIYKYNKNHYG